MRVADGERIWGTAIARAATGLAIAGDHGLPTVRLIAFDSGIHAGAPALLESYYGESSEQTGSAMASAGVALAAVHSIHPPADSGLVPILHHTPEDDHPRDRRWARCYRTASSAQRPGVVADLLRVFPSLTPEKAVAWLTNTPTSALLEDADARIGNLPAPEGNSFLHGDVWFGNMAWHDARCTGLLDWKSVGIGHPGVDLGSLRMRATFAFGPTAAAEATAGWEEDMGQHAEAVAYWDAVAALHTAYGEDTEARDAFLEDALSRLAIGL